MQLRTLPTHTWFAVSNFLAFHLLLAFQDTPTHILTLFSFAFQLLTHAHMKIPSSWLAETRNAATMTTPTIHRPTQDFTLPYGSCFLRESVFVYMQQFETFTRFYDFHLSLSKCSWLSRKNGHNTAYPRSVAGSQHTLLFTRPRPWGLTGVGWDWCRSVIRPDAWLRPRHA